MEIGKPIKYRRSSTSHSDASPGRVVSGEPTNRKKLVLDLMDVVLLATNQPLEGRSCNLQFDFGDSQKRSSYIYFRPNTLSFLSLICTSFEVTLYSCMRKDPLKKILSYLNKLDNTISFH